MSLAPRQSVRVRLAFSQEMKFPSVKAQETMLLLSDCGEWQSSKPDLFDPNLDESLRHYEFSFLTEKAFSEFEAAVRRTLTGDAEIVSIEVEAPAAAEPKAAPAATLAASRQLRVDSRRLEELNRLAGELVILKEQVASASAALLRHGKNPEVLDLSKSLRRTAHGLHELAGAIQDRTREFQQVPIGSLLQRFQRIAHDTSRKLGKRIDCVIEGAETEVDGGLLDRVGDLLVHLVRNAADHGIEAPELRAKNGKSEMGTIRLTAYHEEGQLVIEVADDGGGIDSQKIGAKAVKLGLVAEAEMKALPQEDLLRFIFRSGFSTSAEVSEVSGRGVGLDVVKSRVEEMNGLLDLRTELGKGSTFLVRLPLSISIVQALLVEAAGEVYALPLASVLRVLRWGADKPQVPAEGGELQLPEGKLHSLVLSRLLGLSSASASHENYLVELGYGVDRYGLFVDRVLGRREIVIRPLGRVAGKVDGVAGVATLGDGRIVVVLDPRLLVERRAAANQAARSAKGERS